MYSFVLLPVCARVTEFPVQFFNTTTRAVDFTFHRYVRPVQHPHLSAFCTQLTGIEQATVDQAQPFPSVYDEFQQFLLQHKLLNNPHRTFAFVTCGDWDLKTMLPSQFALVASGKYALLSCCPATLAFALDCFALFFFTLKARALGVVVAALFIQLCFVRFFSVCVLSLRSLPQGQAASALPPVVQHQAGVQELHAAQCGGGAGLKQERQAGIRHAGHAQAAEPSPGGPSPQRD
jgi:hypothetical protein